ncbi:MAG: GntR family transcriptional regulator [Zoogloeaceae bacterium]|jgi:GntR family transcriptional regulator|nr:GntR family transcriptional regulator [Zoogloeaceae bacterium]
MTGHQQWPPASRGQQSWPLYAQIKDALREEICTGKLRQHERIPSESELGRLYKASRITVRRALSDLENEQLIFKVAGKGAFVAKPRPFQKSERLQGFGEAMQNLGITVTNRVVSFVSVAAPPAVAVRLQVSDGSPLIEIRRVRYADGNPISFDVTYVRRVLGERLAHEDLAKRDIFLIIENDYATPLAYADLMVDAVSADAVLAEQLGVSVGAPILRCERLTWTTAGEPIDFEYLYYRNNAFRYQLRASRG